MTHTPGPWSANGRYIGVANHMSYIAECRDYNGNWTNAPMAIANARLIAAAPELLEGGTEQTAILRAAQKILTRYLMADGLDAPQAISELLWLLDGPTQRLAQNQWDAAIAKAEGRS